MPDQNLRPIVVYIVERHPLEIPETGPSFRWLHMDNDFKRELEGLIGFFANTIVLRTSLAANPTFVLDYPAKLCPLTKPSTENPDFAERFELFIGKMEIANAYTELNDPAVQEAKLRQKLKG